MHRHLERHEVRYLQFAFRWMNNLLTRELPLRCAVRLWDTYQVSPLSPWGPLPRTRPVSLCLGLRPALGLPSDHLLRQTAVF